MVSSENVDIENNTTITVVFPDSQLPEETNGGFQTREEFLQFVVDHQRSGKWNSELHIRPEGQRIPDYKANTFPRAFPFCFPYGHSGLEEDPAVLKLSVRSGYKKHMKRQRGDVLKKYLQHRKPAFHAPMINLIIANTLMKQKVFTSVAIRANMKASNGKAMAEKYGEMTSDELQNAILNSRSGSTAAYSTLSGAQYLQSIEAMCRSLPHTNEASAEARRIYFSFLMHFGLPCIFLTITPDDQRNFRIVVYALPEGKIDGFGKVDVNSLTPEEILADFKVRQTARSQNPGLCAEEYARIMELVIRHVLNWDDETGESKGCGIFGELLAWCLATEEQGRKTLHGHWLLFVKDWMKILEILQWRRQAECTQTLNLPDAECKYSVTKQNALKFFGGISSATLFHEFKPNTGVLSQQPVFYHRGCRSRRREEQMQFAVLPINPQSVREMRHKQMCYEHRGAVGTCQKCMETLSVDTIVTTALNYHFGRGESNLFCFPDNSKRLDRLVYEEMKDFQWCTRTSASKERRYFASNASVNLHSWRHATRCFKKGCECFACLPEVPNEKSKLSYSEDVDLWSDYYGVNQPRFMFRYYPSRGTEDAFVNTHNPFLTRMFPWNTNVLPSITGRAVFYVTCYNIKAQQKEEKVMYESVAREIVSYMRKQEIQIRDETLPQDTVILPEYQQGFRRLMGGVMTHCNAHILSAPMAHYLSLKGSRFRYSHSYSWLPSYTMEKMLSNEDICMGFKIVDGKQVAFHQGMNYTMRSDIMSELPLYKFYEEVETLTNCQCKNYDAIETHALAPSHPLLTTHSAVYRSKKVVPVFPWNWLPATRHFATSLEHAVDATNSSFLDREKYCKRFLILFKPFRTLADIIGTNETYQEAFAGAIREKIISPDSIEIANNIQAIHNSLASAHMENDLIGSTDLAEELDNFDVPETDQHDLQEKLEALGAFMMASTIGIPLSEEAQSMTQTIDRQVAENLPETMVSTNSVPTNAVVYAEATETQGRGQGISGNQRNRFQARTSQLNSLLLSAGTLTNETGGTNIVAKGDWYSIAMWGKAWGNGLDPEQQVAFEILTAAYVLSFFEDPLEDCQNSTLIGENKEALYRLLRKDKRPEEMKDRPLVLFVTGPAGSGKCKCPRPTRHIVVSTKLTSNQATLLEAVNAYCKAFSNSIGHVCDSTTIRLTALTGVAASEIGGDTTSREFSLNSTNATKNSDITACKDTRMCVIDEISFADYNKGLIRISERLQSLTQCKDHPYGRMPVVFLGDFKQLEPVKGKSIIQFPQSYFWEEAITNIVELKQQHRFRDCPRMQKLMSDIANGENEAESRATIASRMINLQALKVPDDKTMRCATFTNKKRAELNKGMFLNYLENHHATATETSIPFGALVIKGNPTWGTTKRALSFGQRKVFFEEISEGDCKNKNTSKRAAPLLTLYTGCPVMSTENKDVPNGIANGTTGTFRHALLKEGKQVHAMKLNGHWVNAIDADDVLHLRIDFHDCKKKGSFIVKPTSGTYHPKFPLEEYGVSIDPQITMQMVQFKLVANFATTTHKLQGKSVDFLVIAEWSNLPGWPYVALSRVTTLDCLFILKDLPTHYSLSPDPAVSAMLTRLRETRSALPSDIEDLEVL